MKTAVQRWGNSLALRIPKAYALETQLHDGSEVELSIKGANILISPIKCKRHSLSEMIQQITPANLHESIETGASVGKEVW